MALYPVVVNGVSYTLAQFDLLAYATGVPNSASDAVREALLLHYGTSSSSVTIGTGSKVFTTQAGLGFRVGDRVFVGSNAAPQTNRMWGTVTAYNFATGSITVNVLAVYGSGTLSSWVIGIGGADAAWLSDSVHALDNGGYASCQLYRHGRSLH